MAGLEIFSINLSSRIIEFRVEHCVICVFFRDMEGEKRYIYFEIME